jgi:hypothetical protein
MRNPTVRIATALACTLLAQACSDGAKGPDVPACTTAAPQALQQCVAEIGVAIADCYEGTGRACPKDDPATSGALGALALAVEASCADGDFEGLSTASVVGRLQNACQSNADSVGWRTWGGPQGAVLANATEEERTCLAETHATARDFMDAELETISSCLATETCEPETVAREREGLADVARAAIAASCPEGELAALIAVDAAVYVERASHRVDCLIATGHTETAGVELGCGPSNVDFEAPRGEWTRIEVDGGKWNTLCGDGSPFSFWIRPAPEGYPLDRVLIGLQGGGICAFGEDCRLRFDANPGLFTAEDDLPLGSGIASDDPAESPFANWTKIYVPYCNQDVFTGGGVFEEFPEITVPRFGGNNLRATVGMTQDWLWNELDRAGDPGYRPDEVVVLFGGWSAGAYGAMYNYTWLTDEILWPQTIGFPDAGQGLDNGELVGVYGLGLVKIPAWGVQSFLPPYCFAPECAIGPNLYRALSPRLLQVPRQQMLILSNQKDLTQQRDAYFFDEAFWMNTQRESYCETRALPGIHYYYTSTSDESIHVVTLRPDYWEGEVAGQTMKDWFVQAVDAPETLVDRVEEGDFVTAVPGTLPFPCEVAP